jgi:cob(I)alamin adenosyltransferase
METPGQACREAERVLVELHEAQSREAEQEHGEEAALALAFLNRLSDYLFVATRVAAAAPAPLGGVERPYRPCSRSGSG